MRRAKRALCPFALPLALLGLSLALPAHATRPEADASRVLAPMPEDPRDQFDPQIASDGRGTHLVVWQQGQNYFEQQTADIYAARVRDDGTVLDASPLAVSTAPDSQERPQVTFHDGIFLVTWHDLRNGSDWDVYGARITPEGKLLDPGGFPIAKGPHSQAMPAVAAAPGGFLVVWQDFSNGRFYRLFTARVDTEGKATAASPLRRPRGQRGAWYGYTPGWGFGTQPLTRDYRHGRHVHGGAPTLAPTPGGWMLSWVDETNWAPGAEGGITRRFGFLAEEQSAELRGMAAPNTPWLGRSGGRLAAHRNTVLFAGWSDARRHRYGTAALFEGGNAAPIQNPNKEPRYRRSAWDTSTMILLSHPRHLIGKALAIASGRDAYLVAMVQPPARRGKYRLVGMRLTPAGKRIDPLKRPLTLIASTAPIAAPALSQSGKRFLAAFERQDQDRRRIWIAPLRLP